MRALNPREGDSPIFADTKIGTVPENLAAKARRLAFLCSRANNESAGGRCFKAWEVAHEL